MSKLSRFGAPCEIEDAIPSLMCTSDNRMVAWPIFRCNYSVPEVSVDLQSIIRASDGNILEHWKSLTEATGDALVSCVSFAAVAVLLFKIKEKRNGKIKTLKASYFCGIFDGALFDVEPWLQLGQVVDSNPVRPCQHNLILPKNIEEPLQRNALCGGAVECSWNRSSTDIVV